MNQMIILAEIEHNKHCGRLLYLRYIPMWFQINKFTFSLTSLLSKATHTVKSVHAFIMALVVIVKYKTSLT